MKRNIFAGKRQSGGLGLNLFTNDELEEIHMATLEVLEKGILRGRHSYTIYRALAGRFERYGKYPESRYGPCHGSDAYLS